MGIFQDIRPLKDAEVNKTLLKYVDNPTFFSLVKYAYPHWTQDDVNKTLNKIDTVKDFQDTFIYPATAACIDKSIDNLTFSGLEHIKPNEAYLFITNHRDIVLDSGLLFYILYQNNYKNGQIAIGDNLIVSELANDIVRLNKSFLVHRSLDTRESILRLKTLSAYMHSVLFEQKESIWISQREGRTKDGNDQTYPGVLKMIALQEKHDKIGYLLNSKIVPVSISYEYDSCDVLKAKEMCKRAALEDAEYQKEPMEDVNSIIYGVKQQKGRVHIAFGKEITPENTPIQSDDNTQEQYKALCEIIDNQIHKNTKLFPVHYIAHDLLHNANTYQKHYTPTEKTHFKHYIEEAAQTYAKENTINYKTHLLNIYANTLQNTVTTKNNE